MKIGNYTVDSHSAPFLIAELSANHGGKLDLALATIQAAKKSGAHAVKIQTYTPDTMTIASQKPIFQIKGGTLWDGKTLHDLYKEAYTPWEWHEKLQKEALNLGLEFFSTPFDYSAVDFLESLNIPIYKIASFEIVDLPLIKKVAQTKKPILISTGMANLDEIKEAVDCARTNGSTDICLLKCTSAYPASASSINLNSMKTLEEKFSCIVGLSDHTIGISVPVAATALSAKIIEKHFTLSRKNGGPDSSFSLEPEEFNLMAQNVQTAWKALGTSQFGVSQEEKSSVVFRRSLFIVKDIKKGERFTMENVRSIRPGNGLHPKFYDAIISQTATSDLSAGTPLEWNHVQK